MRANYPMVANEPNETLMEIGEGFKEYLSNKFAGQMDKLEPIWNINPIDVVMAQASNDPFKINGYHPALLIHFKNFIDKTMTEAQSSDAKK